MRSFTLFALAVAPLLLINGERSLRSATPAAAASLLVTPDWLEAHLDDPDLVILEVADGAEYKNGHVRRARPVDIMAFHGHGSSRPEVSHLVSRLEALGIGNASRIVLYGDNMSTSLFWVVLEYVGLGGQTTVLDGGKPAWIAAGKPLTREAPSYLAGKLVPRPRPETVVDAGWILARLKDPRLALIDGRSPGEFAGEPDPLVARPGHIPGAMNLDWEETFDSTGRLRPIAELRDLFTRAGYAVGDELMVYCTVGMRASHLYFVARHLGLMPRIYLGSMSDWASDPARPVSRASAQ